MDRFHQLYRLPLVQDLWYLRLRRRRNVCTFRKICLHDLRQQFLRWIGIYKHYWRSFQFFSFAWLAQGWRRGQQVRSLIPSKPLRWWTLSVYHSKSARRCFASDLPAWTFFASSIPRKAYSFFSWAPSIGRRRGVPKKLNRPCLLLQKFQVFISG